MYYLFVLITVHDNCTSCTWRVGNQTKVQSIQTSNQDSGPMIYIDGNEVYVLIGPGTHFFIRTTKNGPVAPSVPRIWVFIHPASPGHPSLPGHARGLRTKEMHAKRRGNFPRVVWPRLVGERGRSSSSSHRLPRIVVFPRIVFRTLLKPAADGRAATRQGELMRGRLYIAGYRAPGRPHSTASPQSTLHLL
jgi:hypothetical protein